MKLIENARSVWGHMSTQGLAVATVIGGVWVGVPDDLKAQFPHGTAKVVAYLILISSTYGLIGKFVDQTPKAKP